MNKEKSKGEKMENTEINDIDTEVETKIKEKSISSDRPQTVKEYLDECPKVAFLVPLSEGEEKGAYDTVCLNGYLMQIEKGVMMDLPKPIVEILANKYNVEMETSRRMASGTVHTKEEIERVLG